MGFFGSLFGDSANPNRSLERLMAELAQKDDLDKKERFYHELLSATLLVALPAAGEGSLPFIAIRDVQGNKVALAFTGKEALLHWRRTGCDSQPVGVSELCAAALEREVLSISINPFGPSGRMLRDPEMQSLAERRIPRL